jgi:hypothetical protein
VVRGLRLPARRAGVMWRLAAALDFTFVRFQYARNPPSTNSVEKVGSSYRMTAYGVNSDHYDVRYLAGTLKVIAAKDHPLRTRRDGPARGTAPGRPIAFAGR